MINIIVSNKKLVNITGRGEIDLVINNIKSIYPSIDKDIEKEIRIALKEYQEIFYDEENGYQNYTEVINDINEEKDKYLIIEEFNEEIINDINRYAPKNLIISIEGLSISKENTLLEKNLRNDLRFIDRYNEFEQKSKKELEKVFSNILKIKNNIEKYNLSPLEKTIYAIDIIRKRNYKEENNNKLNLSRDICDILSEDNDHIVCDGYTKLASAILNMMGIYCEKVGLIPLEGNIGHAVNAIYINDDKYNVHGMFIVDITQYRKEVDGNLNCYNFFWPLAFANRVYETKFRRIEETERNNDNLFYKINIKNMRFNELKSYEAPPFILVDSQKSIKNSIEDFADKTGNLELKQKCNLFSKEKNLDKQVEIGEQLFYKYQQSLKQRIPTKLLLPAIYQVRRIESIDDSINYPLDLETINELYDKIVTNEEKLLRVIFNEDIYEPIIDYCSLSHNQGFTNKEKIEVDIKKMKLLHFLKTELKRKESLPPKSKEKVLAKKH